MRTNRTLVITLACLLAGALSFVSACKKKPPTTTEGAKPVETPYAPPSTQVSPPPRPAPAPVESSPLEKSLDDMTKAGYLKDAFFDYDKYDLSEDARTALSADADWLKRYSSTQVLIEGHCDERGTSEYNMSLGDRRANATKEYLSSLGIDAGRIRTVSYGKERPFCSESSESCWQQNRRAHFVFTAK